MSQFNQPVRRSGGSIDVYTGLLTISFIVLLAGVLMLAKINTDHGGGMMTLVS